MIKPDLVLRLAVAGNRELPPDTLDSLRSRLRLVFDLLERRLAELTTRKPSPNN